MGKLLDEYITQQKAFDDKVKQVRARNKATSVVSEREELDPKWVTALPGWDRYLTHLQHMLKQAKERKKSNLDILASKTPSTTAAVEAFAQVKVSEAEVRQLEAIMEIPKKVAEAEKILKQS